MTTKDFLIRLFSLTIVLIVLYYIFSPYQNCKRQNRDNFDFKVLKFQNYDKPQGNEIGTATSETDESKLSNYCQDKTSW